MKEFKEIGDDQIRIIGNEHKKRPSAHHFLVIVYWALAVLVVAVVAFLLLRRGWEKEQEITYFASTPGFREGVNCLAEPDSGLCGYTSVADVTINDIPLRVYTPHYATMSLHIGELDREDTTIVYAARAADIRADNGGIVGSFVLAGEPRAWGLSKKGYCASINGWVTIGVAANTSLFEQATEQGGYFFRQYPLVDGGKLVDNEPKGVSIRRAICEGKGEIYMVESLTRETFHDFAQALVDLGALNAIYIVGSSAYGWAVDENGTRHEFGRDDYYTGKREMPKNINYIVWRKR